MVGLALAALASSAVQAQVDAAQAGAAFAAGRYEAAAAPILAALVQVYRQMPPDRRARVAEMTAASLAEGGRVAEAVAVVEDTDGPARIRAIARVARALAADGDRRGAADGFSAAARQIMQSGAPRPGPLVLVMLTEVSALIGYNDVLDLTADLEGADRVVALAFVALAGPSGRSDGPPERALAEIRRWRLPEQQPADRQPVNVAAALNGAALALARFGDGDGATAQAAAIRDPSYRAQALLDVAAELAAQNRREVAQRLVRDAEQLLGIAADAAPETLARLVRDDILATLAYAYARAGNADGASRALTALVSLAAVASQPEVRIEAWANAIAAIARARRPLVDDRRWAADAVPQPAPAPAATPTPAPQAAPAPGK